MRPLSALLLCGVVCSLSFSKPAPPPRVKPKEPPAVNLPLVGPTNWGHLEQTGRLFTLIGDHTWSASGQIRTDGKIEVLWLTNGDGRQAPALYDLMPDGTLQGLWGWQGDCEILGNGRIVGDVRPDTIKSVKPAPPVKEKGPDL